jgi:hypothetical protein
MRLEPVPLLSSTSTPFFRHRKTGRHVSLGDCGCVPFSKASSGFGWMVDLVALHSYTAFRIPRSGIWRHSTQRVQQQRISFLFDQEPQQTSPQRAAQGRDTARYLGLVG